MCCSHDWVVITSFKDAPLVDGGPYYVPFIDFQPKTDGWKYAFNISTDPFCDVASLVRHLWLNVHNAFAFIVSPVVTIPPMQPQICKIYLAFTNSIVIGVSSTVLCVAFGSMAAYALARFEYKPRFGNVLMFALLALAAILASSYVNLHWTIITAVALALFVLLARTVGRRFKRQARQRRHPVLDHFAAYPSACRGDHSHQHDVSGCGTSRHAAGADPLLCRRQPPISRRLADVRLLRGSSH